MCFNPTPALLPSSSIRQGNCTSFLSCCCRVCCQTKSPPNPHHHTMAQCTRVLLAPDPRCLSQTASFHLPLPRTGAHSRPKQRLSRATPVVLIGLGDVCKAPLDKPLGPPTRNMYTRTLCRSIDATECVEGRPCPAQTCTDCNHQVGGAGPA